MRLSSRSVSWKIAENSMMYEEGQILVLQAREREEKTFGKLYVDNL